MTLTMTTGAAMTIFPPVMVHYTLAHISLSPRSTYCLGSSLSLIVDVCSHIPGVDCKVGRATVEGKHEWPSLSSMGLAGWSPLGHQYSIPPRIWDMDVPQDMSSRWE